MSPARVGSTERVRRVRAVLALALIAGLAGVLLMHWPPAATLELWGLDALFTLRGLRAPPPEICVVALDEDSYDILGCAPEDDTNTKKCAQKGRPWPRGLHADLVRTLKLAGARAIVFDVLFQDAQNVQADRELATALAEAGNVVLGSDVDVTVDPRFAMAKRIEPYAPLGAVAAAVADVGLPTDRDSVVRRTWLMRRERPSLALAAYEVATGDRSHRGGEPERVIDYYGPGRTIPTVSYYQALEPGEYLPPGVFKDKVVFVGLSQPSTVGLDMRDSFPTPFRTPQNPRTFGVEIHATLAGNLFEDRRIRLLPPLWEALALLLLPLIAVTIFLALRPVLGLFALFVLGIGVWVLAAPVFTRGHLWAPLIIPTVVQLPAAYVLSLVWYYLTTVRERERIRRAFNYYLSPEMIEKIVADPSSLNLGGEEIIGTALFTDVKGFTSITESMPAPETARLLNTYFSKLTKSVFAEGGTLIKFIGDAVFAIWGAPLKMDDHPARACAAALAMARGQDAAAAAGGTAVHFHTRIGVHTGQMLVGNLGSEDRFDYTAIGDAINLAHRLEGLNKHFGTKALTSLDTLSRTGGQFIVRPLGRVRPVGKLAAVEIFELVGLRGEAPSVDPRVMARFEAALAEFRERRFREAAEGFQEAIALSRTGDGPSKFYLDESLRLAGEPPPPDWDGTIVFESK